MKNNPHFLKTQKEVANSSPLIIDVNGSGNVSGNVSGGVNGTIIDVPHEPPISTRDEASDALLPIETYEPKTCCDKLCCGSIANMACGWPTGTVRALIAVIISIVTVGVFAFLVIYFTIQNNSNIALAGAGLLSTVLAAVIGYYFGSRTSSPPSNNLSSTSSS